MVDEEPIRVLHILGSLQRGGTESVVFNNYRAIDRSKVQFDIAIDDSSMCGIPKSITDLGCKVYRIPPYTRLPKYIFAIRRICKQGNYKIIHSHMNAVSVFSLCAAWLAGVPVRIAHSHTTAGKGKGEFIRNTLKYLLRPFSRVFANRYFACSEYAARWLFGNRVVDKGRVFVLNNAINTEKFAYDQHVRDEQRRNLGLDDKFVVGHVGRFSPQKNHFFLLEAFNALYKVRNDAVLLLIGGLGSAGGGIEEALRKRIDELGISDQVIFLGAREDISELYQAMDVFTLPSLYEGLGMACIEAQCSGLPCVLSDRVPKTARINKNVKFLPLEESCENWAKALAKSKGERKDYSKRVAEAGYDIDAVTKELEAAYIQYSMSADRDTA
ncbi:glycosyltransferase family 1 protein [Sporolactobacillus terrae]|uniref:Glycosyltransferase family 1 protein n=1 Tax=Sporolactobacillus terrae TaxID=269673 RepID=A0ABX5Q4K8_9BACL|nr:glycosyltransferase family 1 protein [Sporolactobacillus terrae]QAA21576.1 glycosyltransferase family 1 protein [Sporolactobacillus terrae]QAA24548.1 glycosyltransferase family 1 protein [Sporolactobacillus terrae]